MRKLGPALLLIGLAPIAAVLRFAWWLRQTSTVGFAMNWQTAVTLTSLGLIDLAVIATGVWLLRRRRMPG
jgi:hypothetical protein